MAKPVGSESGQTEQLALIPALKVLVFGSRAYWIVNLANFGDGIAYFGILTLLTRFLGTRLHMSDPVAGLTVSLFTGLVTLFMLNGGRISDQMGVRRALTFALATSCLGRSLLTVSPSLPLATGDQQVVAWYALGLMAFGTGLLQPALYAGIKDYTATCAISIGWSLLYAIMNLGIVVAETVSPWLRTDDMFAWGKGLNLGIDGVYACFAGLSLILTLINLLFFTASLEKRDRVTPLSEGSGNLAGYFKGAALAAACGLAMGPAIGGIMSHPKVAGVVLACLFVGLFYHLRHLEPRFAFFIFILVPVRTLFAHQWLTMPDYVFRCFDAAVGKRFEWLNAINPFIIFFGVPLIASWTRNVKVINMMILGTTVSAVTTFLLVPPPNVPMLLGYLVLFSLGEAMWSSRFLEYVGNLAPEGETGAYMGVANLPWFLAKFTTGLYSGAMLAHFVPEHGAHDPTSLWLIYACVACISPLGLSLGRSWILQAESRSKEGDVQNSNQPT